MTRTIRQNKAADLLEARGVMSDLIDEAISTPGAAHSGKKAIRIEVRVESSVDPLVWMMSQSATQRTYWASRDKTYQIGGVGAADLLARTDHADYAQIFKKLRTVLDSENDRTRYYGGFAFDFTGPNLTEELIDSKRWAPFGKCHFVLPRFEVTRSNESRYLSCNLILSQDRNRLLSILDELNQLNMAELELDDRESGVRRFRRTDNPDKVSWGRAVESALDAIENNGLEKIVIARNSALRFEKVPPVGPIFRHLKDDSPGCFHFFLQPDSSSAFMGASPELLYSRIGKSIVSEAIAGTRTRGRDESDDVKLERDLLSSEKDAREHSFVVDSIGSSFHRLCKSVDGGDDVRVLKLRRVQHLIARFRGELHDAIEDSEIVASLHPSPAVGGVPTATAIRQIAELEKFSRGWYAAPVGWVGHDSAEFAVAIRSGLLSGNNLSLFSGAGIISGSDPEDEWNEIESKISTFIKAINRVCK